MNALPRNKAARVICFSGIDGAGKSTQIHALCATLQQAGQTVLLIRFWDDVAMMKHLREAAGHRIFKGDKGVGTPEAPIHRRDKNVQSLWMTGVRLFIYFCDAISLRAQVKKSLRSHSDVVICDRYMYDELVNLALSKSAIRAYAWFIMKLTPKPDLSFLLDADPDLAYARKPEYPLEFQRIHRRSYLAMAELIGGFTIINSMPVEAVQTAVLDYVRCVL